MKLHHSCKFVNPFLWSYLKKACELVQVQGTINVSSVGGGGIHVDLTLSVSLSTSEKIIPMFFMPPPFEEWWRGIKCNPCPLNNFSKTASIQIKFGMLIYNIKTQVEFDMGYNPLMFDGVMGLYKNIVQKLVSAQLAGASVSYGHISSFFQWFP